MSIATTTHSRTVTIGTRASRLALAQTEIVRAALLSHHPDLEIKVRHITTKGDVIQDRPLSEIGGNGLFVTQIEAALREGQVDLAVHSAKDLPSQVPPDMALAAFLPRADVRDVLVSREGLALRSLPEGARIGTSSPRRACQVKAMRPDLAIVDIRGNVDTRLRKLREGQYEAIVLAAAGLERLDLLGCVTEWFSPKEMIPAVAQGALAVEVRAGDAAMLAITAPLNHPETSVAVRAERAFLARIGGGCDLPIGAYARCEGDQLIVTGMIGSPDGRIKRGEQRGSTHDPEAAGAALAGGFSIEL
jgi:hydroxymethylbilane synthase